MLYLQLYENMAATPVLVKPCKRLPAWFLVKFQSKRLPIISPHTARMAYLNIGGMELDYSSVAHHLGRPIRLSVPHCESQSLASVVADYISFNYNAADDKQEAR